MVERTTQKTGSMWRLFVLQDSPTSSGGGYNSPNSSLLGCTGTIADEGYPWDGGMYPTVTEVHDATNRLSAGGEHNNNYITATHSTRWGASHMISVYNRSYGDYSWILIDSNWDNQRLSCAYHFGGAFTGSIGRFCSVSAVHTWVNGDPHNGGDLNVNDETDIHCARLSM